MRAYLIDPFAKTVTEVDIDDASDFDHISELLGSEDTHLTSSWLTPKDLHDTGGGDHLGDYCYSGTFFSDINPAEFNEHTLPALFAQCRAEIAGNPEFWFQIDADRPAPATFPVPSRAVVIGVTGDGDWTDAEMSLQELQARVTFLQGRLRRMTLRDDLEQGATWVGPIVLVQAAA